MMISVTQCEISISLRGDLETNPNSCPHCSFQLFFQEISVPAIAVPLGYLQVIFRL